MEPKKVNPSTQREKAPTTTSTIQKIKAYLPSILAVVIATAFFIHMSISPMPEKFYQTKTKWEAAKAKNAAALDALKQLNFELRQGNVTVDEFLEKQPALVDVYTQINREKDELYDVISEAKSESKFLQFDSFQFFLGEIGWAAGLLLYAFVNLLYVFYLKKSRHIAVKGRILLHGALLFIGLFYTCYVFYSKDDFNRGLYFLAMALSAAVLIMAGKLMVDAYLKRMMRLKGSVDRLMQFIFRVRLTHYRKVAVKALYAEKQNAVINPEDTVEDNANAFEEDFYGVLEHIEV